MAKERDTRESKEPFFLVVSDGDFEDGTAATHDTEQEALADEEAYTYATEHHGISYVYRCIPLAKIGPSCPRLKVTRLDAPKVTRRKTKRSPS